MNDQASLTGAVVGGSDLSGAAAASCSGSLEVESVRAARRRIFCSCFTFLASSFCRFA